MRTPIISLSIMLAVAMPGTVVADGGQGLSLRPDSVPWPRLQSRIALATAMTPLRADVSLASEAASVRGMSLVGDYYLTGALLGSGHQGGLRATSALLVGPRAHMLGAGMLGMPDSGRGLVVNRFPAGASAPYEAEGNTTLPYFGIGYTGMASRGGLSFSADFGVVALQPGTTVRLGRPPGSQNVDEVLRELRLSPMLQLGVSYSF